MPLHSNYKVLLDACVRAPAALCDLLLRLAESPRLYSPAWSPDILDETGRVQRDRLGFPPALSQSWRTAVETHFPEAMVTGYEVFLPVCKNQEKDRHVLAAAIKGKANLIVTANIRDFPADTLAPFDLTVSLPADYLITLYSINPAVMVAKIDDIARDRNVTREVQLAKIGRSVPAFSRYIADALSIKLPQ